MIAKERPLTKVERLRKEDISRELERIILLEDSRELEAKVKGLLVKSIFQWQIRIEEITRWSLYLSTWLSFDSTEIKEHIVHFYIVVL
jgi:hypothetical protein